MLTVRKTSPAIGVSLQDVPLPAPPGPGEARIGIAAAGICGTDVHVYEWTSGYEGIAHRMPFTLGHEFSGVVEAIGPGVCEPCVGQRVTVMPGLYCGRCRMCEAGITERCERRIVVGLGPDGGFASHVVVPSLNCLVVPEAVDMELAALAEPLAVSMRAVVVAELAEGQTVVVLGAGMIGLGFALLARIAGARVVVVGKSDPFRLGVARDLGFQHVIDVEQTALRDALACQGIGRVERVFEATGAPSSVIDGFSILERDGVLVASGIHARPLTLDLTQMVRNRHQLRGSHGSLRSDWMAVLDAMATAPEEFRRLITHRLPLDRAEEGFELARRREAMKVLLAP